MPKIAISFPVDFPDLAWAGSVFTVDAPDGDHSHGRSGEWVLGRHPAADLTLACREISKRHAALMYSYAANRWTLTDLNSTNHTRVNGELLSPGDPRPVHIGDRIHLGPHLVNLVEDEGDTVNSGPETIVGTAPLDHRTGEILPTAPPPPKTLADTLYLGASWLIAPSTALGMAYRLIVLGLAALVAVLVMGAF